MPQEAGRRSRSRVGANGSQTIQLEGEPVVVGHEEVPLVSLRLDPHNPRLRHLFRGMASSTKLSTPELADVIMKKLSYATELFKNIRDNGGIIDPVHVLQDGTVVEGNCRVACLLDLAKRQPGNPRWKLVPILRLPQDIKPRQVAILQGNFHVSTKNKWEAYDKAGHLHHMHTQLNMTIGEIAKSLGMQERVVERLLKQYQVMTDEVLPNAKNGDGIKFWSHIDELYKRKELADLRSRKKDVKKVIGLILNGRIKGGADVRKLGKVLRNPRAADVLNTHGVDAAVAVVGRSDPTVDSSAYRKVADATAALRSLSGDDLKRLRSDKKAQTLVKDLSRALQQAASIAKISLR